MSTLVKSKWGLKGLNEKFSTSDGLKYSIFDLSFLLKREKKEGGRVYGRILTDAFPNNKVWVFPLLSL